MTPNALSERPHAQRLAALELANEVRLERARLLRELRLGLVRFHEFDLDAPALQGATVFKLLESVRVRRDVNTSSTGCHKRPTRRAERMLRVFECGFTTTVGSLTAARKEQLRDVVCSLVSSQRPSDG
jgi:hypothetical protein